MMGWKHPHLVKKYFVVEDSLGYFNAHMFLDG